MKPAGLALAALLLATGAAQAEENYEKYDAFQRDPSTSEYVCGKDDVDTVFIRHDHLLSDLSGHMIMIETPLLTARKHKRYPVIRYDLQTDRLTLNGKRCRRRCDTLKEACE